MLLGSGVENSEHEILAGYLTLCFTVVIKKNETETSHFCDLERTRHLQDMFKVIIQNGFQYTATRDM
jgi:hypothetical protein